MQISPSIYDHPLWLKMWQYNQGVLYKITGQYNSLKLETK